MIKSYSVKVETTQEVQQALICDVCKKEFDFKKDIMDIQESVRIRYTGGYGSVFGDGNVIEIDICQNCFKEKLGDYVRTECNDDLNDW